MRRRGVPRLAHFCITTDMCARWFGEPGAVDEIRPVVRDMMIRPDVMARPASVREGCVGPCPDNRRTLEVGVVERLSRVASRGRTQRSQPGLSLLHRIRVACDLELGEPCSDRGDLDPQTFAGFAECQQVVIIVVDLAPHDPCGLRIVRCGHLSSKHLDGWYGLT